MGLSQAVVLGLVQGLTEFLPISSSGHLFLIPGLLGWRDAGAGFTAVIQLGTILAVLIYFGKDLSDILKGWYAAKDPSKRGTPQSRLAWAIVIGSVPICVAGLLLESQIDREFRSAYVVAGALIVFGLLLWAAELVAKRRRSVHDVTWKDGAVIGLWQCLALVPGSSRSGSTLTGGLFAGFDRESAARFSFLLSVPAILLSGLYKLVRDRQELMAQGVLQTLIATVVAFVSGYAAIAFLMKYLQSRSTAVFVVYRLALGLAVLGLVATGRLNDRPPEVQGSETHEVLQTQGR